MTGSIDLNPNYLAIVEDILVAHVPGCEVRAFGSRSAWTSKDYSDLDLAVVGKEPLEARVLGRLREAFEDSRLPIRVDVLDWHAIPDNFRKEIERGYVVVQKETGQSGVTTEWHEVPLGEVIELKRGYDLSKKDRVQGSVPVVSSSGVSDYHSEAKVAGPGVVTGRYGTIGEVYFVEEDFWPLNTALYVRDFKGNDPRFISYFLRVLDFSVYSDKAAVPGVNRNHLHQAIVRYPVDIEQQRAIAGILGTLDDKIELNRRMNETLEQMARALFQSWFVDFDPVRAKMAGREPNLPPVLWDLFPERLVDSDLGEIPEGWEVGTLNDAIEILSGGTPRTSESGFWDGDIPWYTAKDAPALSDIFVVTTERAITQAGVDNSSTKILPAGTTIITARGTVGRLACLGIPMAMNQTCYGVRGASGYPDYFTYWNVRNTVSDLRARTHGTVFDTITRETFKIAETLMAPLDVAEAFESVVKPTMKRILENLNESRALAVQRDVLLPRLVSGQLRVREDSISC